MGKIKAYIIVAACAIFLICMHKSFQDGIEYDRASKKIEKTMAARTISLEDRYQNKFVNDVFKDNILLTLHYMQGDVSKKNAVNWPAVEKPFQFDLTLKPNTVFAFHNLVLPQYKGQVAKTPGLQFNGQEGFKSDGFLMGDGVCHLASLINWVARDAGLEVVAPVNHDFAHIPEVPRQYGTSIYTSDPSQNLYIKNNQNKPIFLTFKFDGKNLTVAVGKKAS